MKFICTPENLARGLSQVAPLAGRNAQLPVLRHVLCQTKDGVLHLTCTDLEIGIHTTVLGKVEAEGNFTVPARTLFEYVQQLPTTHPVVLDRQESILSITTEGFRGSFPTAEADEFPLLPSAPTSTTITLPASLFCEGLVTTLFAAAKEETRPEIHSVFVQAVGEELRLAATDSFRLAEEVIPLPQATTDFSFLLPLTTAHEVIRLFSEEESLTMRPHENYITFQSGGLELSSRLMEGSYPDYRQIIPDTHTLTGEVERTALLRALKTLAVFLPRDTRRVTLTAQPDAHRLLFKVAGSETGAGEVEVPFKGEGQPLEILFNIQYLLEGVQRLPTEMIQWQLVSTSDPALLMPVGGSRTYRYLVMPIQA